MSITKRNFLAILTLFTVVLGGVGALMLHYLTPGHYFGGYPLIPVYFYLYGVFYIYMFDACRYHAPKKMVMLFMGTKVLKMLTSVFLLIIYCVAVPDSAVAFLLTFVAFYLGYLIYESWFFFVYEWNKKLKKKLE
ncbi:MAG: hypothetical protein RR365_03810 [Bacteroides sp.]